MRQLILFVTLSLLHQSCDDNHPKVTIKDDDYFPLQIGNYWEFSTAHPGGDATSFKREIVGKTEIQGMEYYTFVSTNLNNQYRDTIYFRKDEQQHVYRRVKLEPEINVFRLNAAEGEHWKFGNINDAEYDVMVNVLEIQLGSEHLSNAKVFSYDASQLADEEYYVTLSKGIGFSIEGSYAWGFTSTLQRARINGLEYTF
jgi:hypothetical protein